MSKHQSLIGKPAPSITLLNYDGESFTLNPAEKALPIALFFYPKAGTYGCTKEACQFRDAIAEKDTFKAGKVEIIGISPDPVEKQKAFVEKNKLTYPVLSDTKGEAAKAYGVGKGMFGLADVARTTIIIDAKGNIRDTVEGTINYGAHSKFVTKWLDKLEAEQKAAAEPAPAAAVETPVTEALAEPAEVAA
ncbi:peroxiredoxin Q [Mycena alexandri]|uniref:thioredoxin-dependent peroxiredoxin n=1 Tax=Mycena alexandri TaxID=1745969 RepID=A0AAD6TDA4_9AGAR|nr:peroxiredoxin Q [Mycena alexandri]